MPAPIRSGAPTVSPVSAVADAGRVERPSSQPAAEQPTGAARVRDGFASGDQVVTAAAYSDRQRVTLDAPVRMVSLPNADGSHGTWRAELELPLAQLGLNGATLSRVSLGEPWRTEATPGEALPFTIDGDRVRISVPNAIPSRDGWGGKVCPAFSVEASNGRAVLVEVQPKQLTRDTTAEKKLGLESSIGAIKVAVGYLEDSATRLRGFLADPTRMDLAPTSTFIDGKPYRQYVAGQLAGDQAALRSLDAQLGPARAAVQASFDRASVQEQAIVLSSALSRHGGDDALAATLLPANSAAVEAGHRVTNLKDNLEATRALLPRDAVVAAEAELATATAAAATANANLHATLDKARATVSPDELLATADDVLGAGQGLRSLQNARGMHVSNVAMWQDALVKDVASALADARASLPRLEGSIAEEQATIDGYQAQLANLTPETVTVDVQR